MTVRRLRLHRLVTTAWDGNREQPAECGSSDSAWGQPQGEGAWRQQLATGVGGERIAVAFVWVLGYVLDGGRWWVWEQCRRMSKS